MSEDPIVTGLKSHIDQQIRKLDLTRETPADEQLAQYKELYHNQIMFNQDSVPVAITTVKVIEEVIKIDLRPIGGVTTLNPLPLSEEVQDGSYYFLPEIPTE